MGVRTKGRRKITCAEIEYVWYVEPGYEDNYEYLNIISRDKGFLVAYPIKQCETHRDNHFIIAKGKRFRKRSLSGCWYRFYTPPWEDVMVTPKLVSTIIAWCEEEGNVEEGKYGDDGIFA